MSHTPDAKADLSAAKCLRSYAKAWSKLHRDIADDFERGAEALEQRAASLEQSDAVMGEAKIERLGESLFALSDKLRASGIISASDAVHDAYERVVADFTALSSTPIAPVQDDDARRDAIIAAYIAGATDVHNNWQEDRDPDFTEAAHDYASSHPVSQGKLEVEG